MVGPKTTEGVVRWKKVDHEPEKSILLLWDLSEIQSKAPNLAFLMYSG